MIFILDFTTILYGISHASQTGLLLISVFKLYTLLIESGIRFKITGILIASSSSKYPSISKKQF